MIRLPEPMRGISTRCIARVTLSPRLRHYPVSLAEVASDKSIFALPVRGSRSFGTTKRHDHPTLVGVHSLDVTRVHITWRYRRQSQTSGAQSYSMAAPISFR